jgi:hypothetical protein
MYRNPGLTVLVLLSVILVLPGCGDDDPSQPGQTRGKTVVDSQDYTWIDIEIRGYQQGSVLALRPNHWSTTELTADPGATISEVSENVFRLSFANLRAGTFVGTEASIKLVVQDSVADDLSGVVVLCDASGPLDISNCSGDCDPLCGLTECHVCVGKVC